MTGYALHPIDDHVVRIELEPPSLAPEPFRVGVNVYAFLGERLALVNSGHPATRDALLAALRELDVPPGAIERVVITGIWPDLYGNADAFPAADVVALAPLQRAEQQIRARVADLRQEFVRAAQTLAERAPDLPASARDTQRVEAFVERFFVTPPRNLRMLPVRYGHTVNLAGYYFRVGPAPGSLVEGMTLFEPSHRWLFSCDLVQPSREAVWIRDVDALTQQLEALFTLEPTRLLPNRGAASHAAPATMKRTSLFINNFLTHAPFAIKGRTNAAELVERDLGIGERLDVDVVAWVLGYRALIGELVRQSLVDSDDEEGLLVRFGLA